VLGNTTDDLLPPYVDYGYSASLGEMFNSDGGLLKLSCGASEIDSAQYASVKSGHSRSLTAAQPPDYTTNDDLTKWCEGNDTEFDVNNFGTPGSDNDCTPVVLGACNDGGTMRDAVAPAPGDLVITEIMPRPRTISATVGQWVEAKVMKDLDLNNVSIDRANDTAGGVTIESPDCVRVTAGSYIAFARNTDPLMNGGVDTVGGFGFSINPTATPDVQLVYGTTVIDAVTWTGGTTGASIQLDPDFTDAASNDSASNFCAGTAEYEATGPNLGTPNAENTQCAVVAQPGECLDGGVPRAIVKPAAGALVLTEALPNAAGTGTDALQEFLELTNTGATAFDLNDLTVKGAGATTNQIRVSDCVSVAPGAFVILAHNADPLMNGGLPPVAATFTLALSTTASILDGATPLDQMTWGTVSDGRSRQLNPANTNTTDNDTATNYCSADTATQSYGTTGNFGTPGAANVCP